MLDQATADRATGAGLDMDDVRRFIELTEKKRELDAEIRALNEQLGELDERLQEGFVQDGVDKITADGFTVYIRKQFWASVAGRDALGKTESTLRAIDVLRANGLSHMVTLGTQSVSSLFRDEEAVAELPPDVREAFEVTEKVKVCARRA